MSTNLLKLNRDKKEIFDIFIQLYYWIYYQFKAAASRIPTQKQKLYQITPILKSSLGLGSTQDYV